jgi:excinuclease ABC subunit B
LAEDLALYLEGRQVNVCYLHSDLKTPQRTEILHKLRSGIFDCVVGVNLLREGLDLPEVALVAIMDADIEGFLRDKRSLIQTIGRAARNSEAKVILYADKITESMRSALDETERRRAMQQQHNQTHNIIPRTAMRMVTKSISPIQKAIDRASKPTARLTKRALQTLSQAELDDKIARLESSMQEAAAQHDYDTAIHLRDEWFTLTRWKKELLDLSEDNFIEVK